MKRVKDIAKIVLINFFVLAALLEIIARILPVQDATNVVAVNSETPIIHFEPHREITSSFGPRLEGVTVKQINNYGYFSDYDYQASAKPDAVVIGDSYVEAMQVSNSESITGLLDRFTGNKESFYAIGFSGSPLSQYLAFAKFAKQEFSPKKYIFLIIGNDFDESLIEYKNSPGFFYYNQNDKLELVEYSPSKLKQIARHSAFIRYLVLNFHIQNYINAFKSADKGAAYYGNTIAKASSTRLDRSKHAVDLFIRDVLETLGKQNVIFVLDGDRHGIYQQSTPARETKHYANAMFEYFKSQSLKKDLSVVDLQPIFFDHFQTHGQRFESSYDAHWNELGHSVAARAVFNVLTSD